VALARQYLPGRTRNNPSDSLHTHPAAVVCSNGGVGGLLKVTTNSNTPRLENQEVVAAIDQQHSDWLVDAD
jgi:hypothetical protein